MKKETQEATLNELFLLFLSKIWIIILCGVVCAGALGVYSAFLQKDEYTASATIYVYKERTGDSASNTYYDSINSQKMVKTYSVVLKSRLFITKVISSIENAEKYNLTTKTLSDSLEIKQVDDTEMFEVHFTSQDKELTYNVLSNITKLAQTEIENTIPNASDVKIIDEPEKPDLPNDKHVFRNTFIGLFIGVAIAMIGIFIFNQLDVVIRNKKKIEDNFNIPVLGIIPRQNVTFRKMEGDEDEK